MSFTTSPDSLEVDVSQNIGTSASPTFNGLNLTSLSVSGSAGDLSVSTHKVSTSQLDVINSVTLAQVPGLSATLIAGKTYILEAYLTVVAANTIGLKCALIASGGLTLTSYNAMGEKWNSATAGAHAVTTTPDANLTSGTAAVTEFRIRAVLVVNAGGVINVQAAQAVQDAGTNTSILANSYMKIVRVG